MGGILIVATVIPTDVDAEKPLGQRIGILLQVVHTVLAVESPKYMIEYKCGGGSHTLRCTHTNFVGMVLGTKADIASYNYFLVGKV